VHTGRFAAGLVGGRKRLKYLLLASEEVAMVENLERLAIPNSAHLSRETFDDFMAAVRADSKTDPALAMLLEKQEARISSSDQSSEVVATFGVGKFKGIRIPFQIVRRVHDDDLASTLLDQTYSVSVISDAEVLAEC
jgi:hypothetical protein